MSPTERELVPNPPLAGTDLAQIILRDVSDLLANDCMLTGHIAYHRVAYEVRVTLHMDNPAFPTSVSTMTSRPRSTAEIVADPSLEAIESAPPLEKPLTDEALVSASERHRDIRSANVARIEHGFPITLQHRNRDGHVEEEQVKYPSSVVEDEVVPPIDRDVSAEVAAALGVPEQVAKEE